jgi:O-antigen/teichoic acid export membrane protein
MSGTTIAQLISIIFYPILSRLYSPEDYGVFGLFTGIYGFLDTIITLRYEMAIIIPRKDKDAINLTFGTVLISLINSLLFLIVIILFKNSILSLLNANKLGNWLYLIPLINFFFSIIKIYNYWLIRKKKFKSASINKICQKSSETAFSISFGFFTKLNGLIIGDIVGRFSLAVMSLYQAIKADYKFSLISYKKIKYNLKKYINFPLYNTLPTIFNTLGSLFPIFIINKYYNSTETGYFNFCRQLLLIPYVFISASLSQVLLQQFTEKKQNNTSLYKDTKKIFFILMLSGCAFIIMIFPFAPRLFSFFFGEKWLISGYYTQILIFSFTFSSIISPFSAIFYSFEKIKIVSLWQFLYFCSISSLFLFKGFNIYNFLIIYSVIDILLYSLYGLLIIYIIKNYEKSLRKSL